MVRNMEEEHLKKIEDLDFKPIFILGLHRSGTSILYKMLASTGYFNLVTAYHILYFDSLLHNHLNNREREAKEELNNLLKSAGQVDRVIDRLQIDADFPEEYGFLLNRVKPEGLNKKNLQVFLQMCRKIQFISDRRKLLLLKNPWDFPNFLFIKQEIPSAKFIFIHRNPLRIINSSIHALRMLLEKRGIYSQLLSEIAKRIYENPLLYWIARLLVNREIPIGLMILTESFARSTEYFVRNIPSLKRSDYIEVRYEDLCKNPDKTMGKILDFLKISFDRSFKDYIKPRKLLLSKDIERMRGYIYKRMRHYISYCGYDKV
jgi:hypothetical protein